MMLTETGIKDMVDQLARQRDELRLQLLVATAAAWDPPAAPTTRLETGGDDVRKRP